MRLFGKGSKSSPRVGPILRSLYDQVDSGNRAALERFLARAPSGCELVATYKSAPLDAVQSLLSAVQQSGLLGSGVVGAEVFGDGVAVYMKGDFEEDDFVVLTAMFMESAAKSGFEVASFAAKRFGPEDLGELP